MMRMERKDTRGKDSSLSVCACINFKKMCTVFSLGGMLVFFVLK